jgi:hypothetical protein
MCVNVNKEPRSVDSAIAQAVNPWLPNAAARVRARVWQVGFVVDKVALGQVFSEYFGFPCQSSFHQKFTIITITRSRYNRPFRGRRAEWTQFHPPLCELINLARTVLKTTMHSMRAGFGLVLRRTSTSVYTHLQPVSLPRAEFPPSTMISRAVGAVMRKKRRTWTRTRTKLYRLRSPLSKLLHHSFTRTLASMMNRISWNLNWRCFVCNVMFQLSSWQ